MATATAETALRQRIRNAGNQALVITDAQLPSGPVKACTLTVEFSTNRFKTRRLDFFRQNLSAEETLEHYKSVLNILRMGRYPCLFGCNCDVDRNVRNDEGTDKTYNTNFHLTGV